MTGMDDVSRPELAAGQERATAEDIPARHKHSRRRRRRRRTESLVERWRRRSWELLLATLLLLATASLVAGLAWPLAGEAEAGRLRHWFLLENGYLLLAGILFGLGLVVLVERLRFLVNHSPAYASDHCPRCQETNLKRIHRTMTDRVLGRLGVPVRRYTCANCHWRGPRIDQRKI